MKPNKKKCEICGYEYDEYDNLDDLITKGPSKCPHCIKVLELRNVIEQYNLLHFENVTNNEIYKKNLYPDNSRRNIFLGNNSSSTLDEFKKYYDPKNRSKIIEELIERIKFAREYLITRIGAQFEILDSIYEKKNVFWKETGNFLYFCHDASFQYVIIKMKELISGSNSKYSISKIKNIILNNSTSIRRQRIFEIRKYKRSGDIQKDELSKFPIVDFINKIDEVLKEFEDIINVINSLRDKAFVHLDVIDIEAYYKQIKYIDLKRIFSALKIIYDGFLCIVAPDEFHQLSMDYNMWFSHLDNIVNEYHLKKYKN